MNAELRAKLLEKLPEMQQDLVNDIEWLEGKPLDGRTVAEAFGRLGGTVCALAAMVEAVIEDTPEVAP